MEPVGRNPSPKEQQSTAAPTPSTKGGKIPGEIFLIFLAMIVGAAFYAGKQTTPNGGPTPEKTEEPAAPEKNKPGRRAGFTPDLGLYSREQTLSTWELLPSRLDLAKKHIFAITGNPGDPHLLEALQTKKGETGLPVYIITGKDTPDRELKDAKELGFSVYKIKTTLERPYGVIIIDSKLVVDISREHWLWETSEPEIVKETGKWAGELMKEAEIR